MLDLLKLLGGVLVGVFRSHAAREAETAFLRQQLVVLQRSAPARLRLRTADRLIFVWLYRLFPSVLEAAVVFKPMQGIRTRYSEPRVVKFGDLAAAPTYGTRLKSAAGGGDRNSDGDEPILFAKRSKSPRS